MSKKQYLQRLGHSWYVRVKVPAALQVRVRNTHIRRALGTRDLDEAARLKWPVLAAIRAYLDGLADYPSSSNLLSLPAASPRAINCTAALVGSGGVQLIAPTPLPVGGLSLDALLERWLDSSGSLKTTQFQRRQAYRELRAFLGGDCPPETVTAARAAEYVDEHLGRSKDSPSTRRRKLSALSAFWEWMGVRQFVPRGANPWKGFRLRTKVAELGSRKKRPYTTDELVRLFSGAPSYPALREVMALALYTGARIEELCALRHEDLRWDGSAVFVRIAKTKTAAGARTLAVSHRIPVAILRMRCRRGAESPQLFHELKGGGYDDKLSWHVGQAFRRHRDACGLSGETDFHSLRRTFITCLENLGVDQVRIARYVGHQLPTLAFTVYSGGSTEATQRKTGRAVRYPAQVEAAVRSFVSAAKR